MLLLTMAATAGAASKGAVRPDRLGFLALGPALLRAAHGLHAQLYWKHPVGKLEVSCIKAYLLQAAASAGVRRSAAAASAVPGRFQLPNCGLSWRMPWYGLVFA